MLWKHWPWFTPLHPKIPTICYISSVVLPNQWREDNICGKTLYFLFSPCVCLSSRLLIILFGCFVLLTISPSVYKSYVLSIPCPISFYITVVVVFLFLLYISCVFIIKVYSQYSPSSWALYKATHYSLSPLTFSSHITLSVLKEFPPWRTERTVPASSKNSPASIWLGGRDGTDEREV